jgi:hypothetical protein
LGKSHACEGLLTTLFGITEHFTPSIARTPSPLPKHYSIPRSAYFVKAEVDTIPRNQPVLNKKPDRTFESTAGLLSAGLG